MSVILRLSQVSLKIDSLVKPIMRDINYQVNEHDFIVILGSNGSGKSTLLKVIDGRYQFTTGSIELLGKPVSLYKDIKKRNRYMMTLTQDCHESLFPGLTVFENRQLIVDKTKQVILTEKRKLTKAIFADHLYQFNPSLSNKLDLLVAQLSGGEKQALVLALVALCPPKLLLLDEHTSALDPQTSLRLMALTQQIIKEHQITCMMVTHDLKIAMSYGNRVMVMKDGELDQELNNSEMLKRDYASLLATCY